MTFQMQLDDNTITVELINKKNIKHCYIRILSNNFVQIKSNLYFSLDDARQLIYKRKNWIQKALTKTIKNKLLDDEFLYLGEIKKIQDFKIKNLDNFYRIEIKKILPSIVEDFSKIMNLHPTSISYRKNKKTWGSCNYKNGLNFNILLMKFPIDFMKYVVVHELAHIKYKNHSRQFWSLVEKYCPNYKQVEKDFKNFLLSI